MYIAWSIGSDSNDLKTDLNPCFDCVYENFASHFKARMGLLIHQQLLQYLDLVIGVMPSYGCHLQNNVHIIIKIYTCISSSKCAGHIFKKIPLIIRALTHNYIEWSIITGINKSCNITTVVNVEWWYFAFYFCQWYWPYNTIAFTGCKISPKAEREVHMIPDLSVWTG